MHLVTSVATANRSPRRKEGDTSLRTTRHPRHLGGYSTFLFLLLPLLLPAAELELHRHPGSDRVAFTRVADEPADTHTPAIHPPLLAAARPAPAAVAGEFLAAHAARLGLAEPRRNLVPERTETDRLGMTRVVYTQHHQGVPVFGSTVIVHLGANGRVRSACTDALPALNVDLRGGLTAISAEDAARKLWGQEFGANHPPTLRSTRQCIFAPALMRHDQSTDAWLVWEVKLVAEHGPDSQNYYLDARTGELRFQSTDTNEIDRKIFDCSSQPGSNICNSQRLTTEFGYPYVFGRVEGSLAYGPNPRFLPEIWDDTNQAYELFGAVHAMYLEVLGRNGSNGVGGTGDGSAAKPSEKSLADTYLNYVSNVNCPMSLFNNGLLYFCKGLIVPDLFAHEYAHGVPHFSIPGGMIYQAQSGALNENFSDISGEIFEKRHTGTNDWIISGGRGIPPNRNLQSPPSLSWQAGSPYPDRFQSPTYYCGTDDNSGVHRNSTVPSKAAYLLSEGGFFNGCTITALGSDKVYQIWYRAISQYYGSYESFNGAAIKLVQSARDLYPNEPETILQVARALQSVELDQAGTCSGHAATIPLALDSLGW